MSEELDILLKGCIEYNRKSQEQLYRKLYPSLFVLCCKFFDDEHDILTALNNGMLHVFNHIEKFDATKGDLKGWVYTIVRNAAISLVRERSAKPFLHELSTDLHIEASANPFKGESDEVIIGYLKILTTTTRAVFNLFYIEGLLIKEIATCLDMKEGTVKWHLSDGRNRLKTFLKPTVKNTVYAK